MEPQDDYLKTALRLPRDLHAAIHESASAAGRSMNAEIVQRLSDSFGKSSMSPTQLVELVLSASSYGNTEGAASLADDILPALKEAARLVQGKAASSRLDAAIEELNGAIKKRSRSALPTDFAKLLREERDGR